jgi:hypothetical protein
MTRRFGPNPHPHVGGGQTDTVLTLPQAKAVRLERAVPLHGLKLQEQ